MSADAHPIVFRIMLRGTCLAFAIDVVVALVLCAVKVVISIPESFKTFMVHLEIESWDTALCGCMKLTNKLFLTVPLRLCFLDLFR